MAIFDEKIEIRERCKGVRCVDLGESFHMSIFLQNLASIQPRTTPVKLARSPCPDSPTTKVRAAVCWHIVRKGIIKYALKMALESSESRRKSSSSSSGGTGADVEQLSEALLERDQSLQEVREELAGEQRRRSEIEVNHLPPPCLSSPSLPALTTYSSLLVFGLPSSSASRN